jgi:hypothetical protein
MPESRAHCLVALSELADIPDDDNDDDVYLNNISTYGLQKTVLNTKNVDQVERHTYRK